MKSLSVTIQMKATEQYFPVVLFMMLYKVVLTLSLWIKSYSVTIHMKVPIKQLFFKGLSWRRYSQLNEVHNSSAIRNESVRAALLFATRSANRDLLFYRRQLQLVYTVVS